MSARQNKKQRNKRNNANHRERTVTTLTEDPNTPYLVPTPSEEPAPIVSNLYQLSSSFTGYPNTFKPQQPSQSQPMLQQTAPSLPPGKNDLEILQNLKQLILDNQHPIYRAAPQPAALANLYQGSFSTSTQEFAEKSTASVPVPGRRIPHKDSVSTLPPTNGSRQNSPRISHPNNEVPNPNSLMHRVGKSVSGSSASHSAVPEIRSAVHDPDENHGGRHGYALYSRIHRSNSVVGDRSDISNGIKKRSMDDPMDSVEAPGDNANLSHSNSWSAKQPPPFSEGVRSDQDRMPSGDAATATGHMDTRSGFEHPADVRDRDRGAHSGGQAWGWQDRNYRRSNYDRPHRGKPQMYRHNRRPSSTSDHHRQGFPARKRGPVGDSSQSHVPVDSRALTTDASRPSDHPVQVPGESVVESERSLEHPRTDARVPPPLSARLENNETDTRLTVPVGPDVAMADAPSLAPPNLPVEEPGHSFSRQSANDATSGGWGVTDPHGSAPRSNSRPATHGYNNRKKFQKNFPHNANSQGAPYGGPASDHPPRTGQGRPPSPPVPPSGTSRPFPARSSSVDGRRGRFASPVGGPRVWDNRPPDARDISRDRPPASYRGDYEQPDVNPMRYNDTRPYGREYSPPPAPFPSGERGERGPTGAYSSPPSGVPSGRDWGGYPTSYPPGNRRDWGGADEEVYAKSRTWEGRPPLPPPPPSERDRYDYPPRSAGWMERDYSSRDSYPPGPPPAPAVDERYGDRSRPQVYGPPYNRVARPRSASPPPARRGGLEPLDDRPAKRPREEYDPVDYYQPSTAAGRRGPPLAEYPPPPPPRTGSPGPPGLGPSWAPPPSTGTAGPSGGTGLPPDRDYRYSPPVSGGFERPRSPGPPRGRPPFSRGGGYGGRNPYRA